ncbi:MAG: VWA domain-containing protein [Acidobacteria bacterium]|nr:VWA domain-containing protein [Acidobacteriota bacterium]
MSVVRFKRPVRASVICLLAVIPAFVGWRLSAQDRPLISVHSDLVVLHVSVSDRKHTLVADLARDAFTVHEDDRPQPISFFSNEDTPVTGGLVIDNSSSMQTKRALVVAAALAFARASNPQDELFIVNFNERARLALPPSAPFTGDIGVLRTALASVASRGRTALYDALLLALDHVKKGSQEKPVLVVVSDGGDNASRATFRDVLSAAQQSNVVIYTVGLVDEYGDGANPGVLKRLARESGGEAFLPDDPGEVERLLQHVARDIREGYTIGYVPTNSARDGAYRTIKVTVQAPGRKGLTVRTRAGYVAASTSTGTHVQR